MIFDPWSWMTLYFTVGGIIVNLTFTPRMKYQHAYIFVTFTMWIILLPVYVVVGLVDKVQKRREHKRYQKLIDAANQSMTGRK